MVNALYRYVGLDPDPPEEFDGYSNDVKEEEIGFGVIEIVVDEDGTEADSGLKSTQAPKVENGGGSREGTQPAPTQAFVVQQTASQDAKTKQQLDEEECEAQQQCLSQEREQLRIQLPLL